ncbi:MAG: UDP-glucose dehydrogenase family protein [Flavobacteriales bacterium AspAUS03]
MNISVIGTGYVGLVTGTCLADRGNNVICVDIDEQKVKRMKNGEVPIYEPRLEEIFKENIDAKRLYFTTELKMAVDASTIIFLALPTPLGEDGSADITDVLNVAEALGKIINSYKVIVNKSTVPVGTAERVRKVIIQNAKVPFDVVSNPEFLREGFAVEDFKRPNRIIIGARTEKAIKLMKNIYKPYTDVGTPLLIMDERSAELTKYAANAFLATKITFMNEVANFSECVGADIDKVRLGMGHDERIGHRFLFPGIGYGGSCFPKDVRALIYSGKQQEYDFRVLKAVEAVNEAQKTILVKKIHRYFDGQLTAKKIAFWGLAFKPNTDDIREASSLNMIERLLQAGATLSVFDPVAMQNVERCFGDKIQYARDMYEVLDGADALIIATEWSEFHQPDFELVASRLKNKAIFDGRNILDPKEITSLGFYYEGIGKAFRSGRH